MGLNNLRLAVKLAAAFGFVVAIVAIGSGLMLYQSTRLAEIERLNSISDAVVDTLDRLDGNLTAARSSNTRFVLAGDETGRHNAEERLAQRERNAADLRTMLVKDGAEFLPLFDAYQAAAQSYVETVLRKELTLAANPDAHAEAVAAVQSNRSAAELAAVTRAFAALRGPLASWSERWTLAGETAISQTILLIEVSGGLSVLLGVVMAWLTTRAISRPITGLTAIMQELAAGNHDMTIGATGQRDEIGEMARAVEVFKLAAIEKRRLEEEAEAARQEVAEERRRSDAERAELARQQAEIVAGLAAGLSKLAMGDLVQRLDQPFAADYEGLRDDYNAAIGKLEQTMREVVGSTGAIRSGTGEIASAADDLSRRTEQQAASLEQTAAALDEITATVRKTAEGSEHARHAVETARSDAQHSGNIVARAVEAMQGIEASSRQIGQITGIIDEIAFQTNLLALNAGVEAARAGDAGRGFAVVASEVRALAQRSAEAAKQIKALILTSDGQVKTGVGLVSEAGLSLTRIVSQVTEISGVVASIATAAQEQASGLAQVNTAVNQMDQVTQQNAAMVEQSTAAAHSLSHETDALLQLIGRFQLGSTGEAPVSRPASNTNAAAKSRPALKVVGQGRHGAARKPVADAGGWEEF